MEEYDVEPGQFWSHRKNRVYVILAVARHTETDERFVVYRAAYGQAADPRNVWARPLSMFLDGRFKYLPPGDPARVRAEQEELGLESPT
jgi:hypothetical protein